MKKFTTFVAAVVMVIAFTVSAFAGPVDWFMDRIGYTPIETLELQKAETAKAVKAAKAATEAATQLAATASFQEKVIDYGGILLLVGGGLAFFTRKRIAKVVLEEKIEKIQPGNKAGTVSPVQMSV